MATVKDIEIRRGWGLKNSRVCNMAWDTELEEGDWYDLVNFSINELGRPYFWNVSLGVKCDTSEEEIREAVEAYAKTITDTDIKEYLDFLADGEKWGWD